MRIFYNESGRILKFQFNIINISIKRLFDKFKYAKSEKISKKFLNFFCFYYLFVNNSIRVLNLCVNCIIRK